MSFDQFVSNTTDFLRMLRQQNDLSLRKSRQQNNDHKNNDKNKVRPLTGSLKKKKVTECGWKFLEILTSSVTSW